MTSSFLVFLFTKYRYTSVPAFPLIVCFKFTTVLNKSNDSALSRHRDSI